jgi:uncharacterized protein YecT (DUF1311 family)
MSNPYRSLAAAFGLLSVCLQTEAAGLPHGARIRVQLSVSGANGGDQSLITSYVSRRLRQIPDVVVVADNPLVTLSIVAFRTANLAGYQTGYAVSVAVTSTFRARLISKEYSDELPSERQAGFRESMSSLADCEDHRLYTCGPDDLKSTCGTIVDNVDGADFEQIRLFTQKLVDAGILTEESQPSEEPTPTDGETAHNELPKALDDNPEYKATEAELNKVYSQLRSTLSQRARIALRDDEVDWLSKREKLTSDPAAFVAFTKARIRELSSRIRH